MKRQREEEQGTSPKKQKTDENEERRRKMTNLKMTPLHEAALDGKEDLVEELVNKNPDSIDVPDALGNTPLILASGAGFEKVCSFLLSRGANVKYRNKNGLTALHLSVRHNKIDVFSELLKHNADVNVGNIDKITPLHLAAKYGREEVTHLLLKQLDSHPHFDFVDTWNQTPLHYAALQNHVAPADILMKSQKMDLNFADQLGMTPFMCAIQQKSLQVKDKMLNDYSDRLDFFKKTKEGKTVVHLLVETQSPALMLSVLPFMRHSFQSKNRSLADFINHELDINGMSAITVSKILDLKSITGFLIEWGATDDPIETQINEENLMCGMCREIYYHPITIACGHTFCRSCLQLWRKQADTWPKCRDPVKLVKGFKENLVLKKYIKTYFSAKYQERKKDNESIYQVMEIFIKQMGYLSKDIDKEIIMNKHNSCIITVNNEFQVYCVFFPDKKKAYIFTSLLDMNHHEAFHPSRGSKTIS